MIRKASAAIALIQKQVEIGTPGNRFQSHDVSVEVFVGDKTEHTLWLSLASR
jgi:hypothetical protein